MIPKEWVIEQGDLYWRADSQGYTKNLINAGLYTEMKAKHIEMLKRTPPDKAIHILELEESIKEDMKFARRMYEALKRAKKRKR